MPIPTDIWVLTNLHDYPIPISGVTAYKRGSWYTYESTYRDEWTPTAEASPVSGGTATPEATVPVIGQQGATPTGAAWTNLIYTAPDPYAHVPPRFLRKRHTGYIISLENGGTIPEPPAPETRTAVFTAATTDICTSVANPFYNGDLVTALSSSALPAGLTTNVIYQFARIDADTFKLINAATGAIVDITNTGTGTHTLSLVQPANLPANTTGCMYFPDEWAPVICTSDPRD